MKRTLSIDSLSYNDMPMPYNAEHEIHKASRDGSTNELIRLLKEHPDLINVPDGKLGWTPLYRVTLCGFEDAVKVLLSHHADPNIGNSLGETPLHQAADNGLHKIVALLLNDRADPNSQQSDGNTPLHLSCFKGDSTIAHMLLRAGANPNIQNSAAGRTALHVAADGCYDEIVSLLIKFNADVNIKDHFGRTAFDYTESKEILALLNRSKSENKENIKIDSMKGGDLDMEKYCNRKKESIASSPSLKVRKTTGTLKKEPSTESFDEYLKRMKDKELSHSVFQYYGEGSSLCEEGNNNEEENDELIEDVTNNNEIVERIPKLLDTLREEDSHLEATANVKQDLEEVKIAIAGPQVDEETKKATRENLKNEVEHIEEVIKAQSRNDISINYQLAQFSDRKGGKKEPGRKNDPSLIGSEGKAKSIDDALPPVRGLKQKMDTNSELFIQIEPNSHDNSESATMDTNMNYTKIASDISAAFLNEQKIKDPTKIAKAAIQGNALKCSHESVASFRMPIEGDTVAVFKSQRNDVPSYINERKRLNINKNDKKVVADLYQELLNQMQNCSKIGDNNTSVEYGDSIFFETINDNYDQFERNLNQEKLKKELPAGDEILELESPTEHNNVLMNAFPIESSGLGLITSDKNDDKLSTLHKEALVNIFPRIDEEMDRWLEGMNLKKIGNSLSRAGIRTKEEIKQISNMPYDQAVKSLSAKGINQPGIRDRLIIALEKASGAFQSFLEKKAKDQKSENVSKESSSLFACCGRVPRMVPDFMNPPSLKHWFGRLGAESAYSQFIKAGYDDYESLLEQMCSAHPLSEEVLQKDIGISKASIRTRILTKLREEADEYFNLILVPKHGLNIEYENISNSTACNCTIF